MSHASGAAWRWRPLSGTSTPAFLPAAGATAAGERGWGQDSVLFFGTYVNKVDRKGRVSVPAAFRGALQHPAGAPEAIILRPSHKEPAIDVFPVDYFESLSVSLADLDLFSDEQDELSLTLFASALQVHFDGEGRVLLPREMAEAAGITTHAAFVGRGHIFQIWEPAAAEASKREAIERARRRGVTLPRRRPAEEPK
ncbi:MAG: cell division/cell wall cluster transcriptional repressor MraZ [Proteobacteria bacterium]|nr:cell division/cell wall cluster transcriptional repressor MraZ [Pseudomonadota bacterium]